MSEIQFKIEALKWAGENSYTNVATLQGKVRVRILMTIFFVVEVVLLLDWAVTRAGLVDLDRLVLVVLER